jgi:hypothetical protein
LNENNNQLLKFGVWLEHPQGVDTSLLEQKIGNLDQDIIYDDAKPRLGGNFQDKICASMLMTKTFDRVQDRSSVVGSIYYPWLKTAGCPANQNGTGSNQEFEVSHRRYRMFTKSEFKQAFDPYAGPGYLKKYFHLWKGDDVVAVDDVDLLDLRDNQSRFRFLQLTGDAKEKIGAFEAEGIIRILDTDGPLLSTAEAYKLWLYKWLKTDTSSGKQDHWFMFRQGTTNQGCLYYKDGVVEFLNKEEMQKMGEGFGDILALPGTKIPLAHGSQLAKNPKNLHYRTDGELIANFCNGMNIESASMDNIANKMELYEALASQICIIDDRVVNRFLIGKSTPNIHPNQIEQDKIMVQQARLELYRDNLLLDVREESINVWNNLKEKGLLRYHFLVVHLSFIESMGYPEDRIIDFIDTEILQGDPADSIKDDFILIVTTGRGRMVWWDKIKERPQYARFATFRPLESITSTIEDAIQVADDINLKFNLVKLFFGS